MTNLISHIRKCSQCSLHCSQVPLVQDILEGEVVWVGLSAVKATGPHEIPLSPKTNSGDLINSIEYLVPDTTFYKTNLVKCLPLKKDKIRYPSVSEMSTCYTHLKQELHSLNPDIVFLLGKQVASFVMKELGIKDFLLDADFNYSTFCIGNQVFVPVHHPSYILIYKRKRKSEYMGAIKRIIEEQQKTTRIEVSHPMEHHFEVVAL